RPHPLAAASRRRAANQAGPAHSAALTATVGVTPATASQLNRSSPASSGIRRLPSEQLQRPPDGGRRRPE
ncbi:MAG: hypothetical protein WA938_08315, partial [Candidatus Dormiibacterota bacterium]